MKKIILQSFFGFLTATLYFQILTAQEPKPKEQVLDFNANVIEGELKKPQLFLELGGDIKDLNGLLLVREDFNDFQVVDMKNRLRFIEIKK